MRVPFVDLKWQVDSLRPEIEQAIWRCIENTAFVQGAHVEAFEVDFARYCGTSGAVGCGSGTDALYLALRALGVGPGDQVIVPTMTFIATAEAVNMLGAEPVFCDVLHSNGTIDVSSAEVCAGEKSKAIVPVHLWGSPCDVVGVQGLAETRGLDVVWDAAQAHGAMYRGRPISSFGGVTCFSFYPGKNLGAFGDAGACVTDERRLLDSMGMCRNHGRKSKYEHEFAGVNMRMDEIQAEILRVKLAELDAWNGMRAKIARVYSEELSGVGDLRLPEVRSDRTGVWHLYVAQTERRDDLLRYLNRHEVGCGVHYPIPLHMQPAYAGLSHRVELGVSERLAARIISLPIFPGMTESQQEFVVGCVRSFFS